MKPYEEEVFYVLQRKLRLTILTYFTACVFGIMYCALSLFIHPYQKNYFYLKTNIANKYSRIAEVIIFISLVWKFRKV